MAVSRSQVTYPYAATWMGAIGPLMGQRGVLSVHARADLAILACLRSRAAVAQLRNGRGIWFHYQVIDRRSGEVIEFVRG